MAAQRTQGQHTFMAEIIGRVSDHGLCKVRHAAAVQVRAYSDCPPYAQVVHFPLKLMLS